MKNLKKDSLNIFSFLNLEIIPNTKRKLKNLKNIIQFLSKKFLGTMNFVM